MPNLVISEFNIVCTVLRGFVLTFGLVSFFVEERLYLSEARMFYLPRKNTCDEKKTYTNLRF